MHLELLRVIRGDFDWSAFGKLNLPWRFVLPFEGASALGHPSRIYWDSNRCHEAHHTEQLCCAGLPWQPSLGRQHRKHYPELVLRQSTLHAHPQLLVPRRWRCHRSLQQVRPIPFCLQGGYQCLAMFIVRQLCA